MTASANRGYMPEVDHLRAFAALMVLFYHGLQLIGPHLVSTVSLRPNNPLVLLVQEGHTGVGLFIVLSGFILSLGAIGNKIHYKEFLVARILRLYPMLIVCLLVAVQVTGSNLTSLLTSLLPVNAQGGVGGSFAALFWAVAVEFQCYLVFPFLIAFSNERGSRFIVQVIAVAFTLRLLAFLAVDGVNARDLSYWGTIGRIDQFCIGMIAARLYLSKNLDRLHRGWFFLSAIVAALVLWRFNRLGGWSSIGAWKIAWPTIEGAMWAFFIVTYVAAGRSLPSSIRWAGAKLGEISYSMYLIHFSVVLAIVKNGFYLRPTGNGHYDLMLTTLLVALPITIAIAILTYYTIELPFLRLRPKYIARTKQPITA